MDILVLNIPGDHGLRKLSLSASESKRIVYFIVYCAKYRDHNIRQNATIITLQSDVILIECV